MNGGIDSNAVLEASTEAQVRRCWPAFHELRPHIADEAEFIARWRTQQREGYQIVYIEVEGEVVAAAGFRYLNAMTWGKVLYLDDLIALQTRRGRGFGAALLRWLQERAQSQSCDAVHLDTGYHRQAAHRTYLRNGFELHCHHLAWQVPKKA